MRALGTTKGTHMYVTTEGVITQPQRNPYLPHRLKPVGSASRRTSRLSSLTSQVNSALGGLLIVAVIASAGLAVAVRSRAEAHAPASVNSFGKATAFANPEVARNDEVVAISANKKSAGYWIATKRGQVFPYGTAQDFGEIPADHVNNVVDIVSTHTGNGYWLMTSQGNIYTYGDAQFLGTAEMQGIFGATYSALLPSKDGEGYTMVGADGGVTTFGDADSYGTATGQLGGDKIIDAQVSPTGKGYVMLSSKGAVFAFGDATFHGAISAGQTQVSTTAIAMTDTADGYWILTDSGSIFPYGDAVSFGTAAEPTIDGAPSVDLAIHVSGDGYWIANGKAQPKPPAPVAKKPAASGAVVPAVEVSNNADNADVWARLRNCESHGNYATNTGNGYYGAYQFSAGTWNSMNTGYERADLAPPEVQDDAARRLQARSGWGQWPVCSRNAGAYR